MAKSQLSLLIADRVSDFFSKPGNIAFRLEYFFGICDHMLAAVYLWISLVFLAFGNQFLFVLVSPILRRASLPCTSNAFATNSLL